MEELIRKLYPGIQTTTFKPKHAQDRLSNDFRCYADYLLEFRCHAQLETTPQFGMADFPSLNIAGYLCI